MAAAAPACGYESSAKRKVKGLWGILFVFDRCKNMGLNIKNDETYRLVEELVKLTGETLTGAVTQAVRERCSCRSLTADRQRLCGAPEGAVPVRRSW